MNQHPKAKAKGITPGTCNVSKHSTHNKSYLFSDVIGTTAACISNNDAPIMADALNTMNAHGHTPSEMVEIIRELRRVLRLYNNLSDDDIVDVTQGYIDFEDDVLKMLNKTEDFR